LLDLSEFFDNLSRSFGIFPIELGVFELGFGFELFRDLVDELLIEDFSDSMPFG
jgi:hypothetical protein